MTYNIISTGSKGNAVVINGRILIDCGVPFKALEPVKSLTELLSLLHVFDSFVKSPLGDTQRLCGDTQSSYIQ